MRRYLLVIAVSFVLVLGGARPGAAAPGGMDDPQGDWTSGKGPLDVKRIGHDNDANTIRYTVESFTDFDINMATFKWSIDCTPTDNRGDNMYVSARFLGGQGVVVQVYHSDKNQKIADGTVSKSGPILTVTYPRNAMHSSCATVTSYQYSLYASSSQGGNHADPVPRYPEPKPVHNLGVVAPTTTRPPATTTTAPPPAPVTTTTVAPAETTTTLEVTEAAASSDVSGDEDSNPAVPIAIGVVALGAVAGVAAYAVRRRAQQP